MTKFGSKLQVSILKKFTGGGGLVACLIIVSTTGPKLEVSSFEKFTGGGGVVACLIIVSTPGPRVVRIRARFWSGW